MYENLIQLKIGFPSTYILPKFPTSWSWGFLERGIKGVVRRRGLERAWKLVRLDFRPLG